MPITTPRIELLDIASFISIFFASKYGTNKVPPPIPTIEDTAPKIKLMIFKGKEYKKFRFARFNNLRAEKKQ